MAKTKLFCWRVAMSPIAEYHFDNSSKQNYIVMFQFSFIITELDAVGNNNDDDIGTNKQAPAPRRQSVNRRETEEITLLNWSILALADGSVCVGGNKLGE